MLTRTSLDKELTRISGELARRAQKRNRISFHMYVWHLTVGMSYFIKRLFDILISGAALFVLSPLFLLLAIWIKLDSPGPVIYRQIRVGRFGRHFRFYKFRTMRVDADRIKSELLAENQSADGVIFKMKRDPRITRLGRYLRKFSIDELPQLFNVLLGDMSLVGPRPPLPDEVRQYTLEDRKRLNVVPGLTCIWQVCGRSDIPFSKQVQLDKEYIASHGFWRDCWLLIRTIPAILTGKGAY
ncbi:MAG: sugar transferase [Victivallales bacterium]|jgi:lipopolysaccharide/colanic/teichoic acid biosynthesis glycosyltransferase|nr:sugar transferase [Victivallales bacterium]